MQRGAILPGSLMDRQRRVSCHSPLGAQHGVWHGALITRAYALPERTANSRGAARDFRYDPRLRKHSVMVRFRCP